MIAPTKPSAGDAAGDAAERFNRDRRRRKRRRRIHSAARQRRRAEKFAGDRVLRAAGFSCVYCGADLLADVDSFLSITRDHLVARSHGGSNRQENLVLCCRTCDRLKAGAFVTGQAEARALIDHRRQQQAAVLERLRELVGWSGEA